LSSTTSPVEHDRLASRLTQILLRLNEGECLRPAQLAAEFGVSLRTIQRDIGRFASLPLERDADGYRLAARHLGRLNFLDLEHFADRAGVRDLYPQLEPRFLAHLLDGQFDDTLHIQGHPREDMRPHLRDFVQLENAIQQRRHISFHYAKSDGGKFVEAAPYQLIHHNGIWYLAALDGDRLKSYSVTKISRLLVSEQTFERLPQIEQQLREEDSIWLNRQKTEVVLQIAKPAAGYFRRRKLIAGQKIEQELADGSLIVSARVAHVNQILPIVRYWLPNACIRSPSGLQADLEQSLRNYLEQR
jgi:predicted DNA-binding transcriptional regulator YafY